MVQDAPSTNQAGELKRPDLYINRELSWIEFNQRVFEEARDPRHPLLERVKFISIFDTNLDEFMMIRLAGLKDQIAARVSKRSPDGLNAVQQLEAVRQRLAPMVQDVRRYWQNVLQPLLIEQDIHIVNYEQLSNKHRESMREYFENEIFPVLTPLAVDPGHPFPHISNRSLNLAVVMHEGNLERFARVKVPPTLPRLVPIKINEPEQAGICAFVWIEQLISAHLNMLFPGIEIDESYPFRVLRDADFELREDEAGDLMDYIERGLKERRFGSVVDSGC